MLDDHEGTRTITKTPLYTFDWYIKWVASRTTYDGHGAYC